MRVILFNRYRAEPAEPVTFMLNYLADKKATFACKALIYLAPPDGTHRDSLSPHVHATALNPLVHFQSAQMVSFQTAATDMGNRSANNLKSHFDGS